MHTRTRIQKISRSIHQDHLYVAIKFRSTLSVRSSPVFAYTDLCSRRCRWPGRAAGFRGEQLPPQLDAHCQVLSGTASGSQLAERRQQLACFVAFWVVRNERLALLKLPAGHFSSTTISSATFTWSTHEMKLLRSRLRSQL